MRREHGIDVLLVSLGSTVGLRRADDELHDALVRAGARVAIARPHPRDPLPTLMLTDLAWARAARSAAAKIVDQRAAVGPRSIVYSTTTAALLWKVPGAIRFDATGAGNRRGRHGLWQRPLERRRLRQAPLLLPWSESALQEAPATARAGDRALVLPVPVEPSGPPAPERDVAALTYGANPTKKGLDRVIAAWRTVRARRAGDAGGGAGPDAGAARQDELLVAGATAEQLQAGGLIEPGEPGVRALGTLAPGEFRELLRRTRAFVCAPRREDYGIAQLEALADGAQLVTTPSPGPYAALPIARELDARLVSDDLAAALHAALEQPAIGYAERAAAAVAPFSRDAVDAVVAEQLLPRLLA
ncbi:MAG TPA: glycosyltransferase [Solirubrobacteraceae bacterium]|nr:glycosyltransferase [Solirubrobacteraceae bacterium]